VSGQVKTDAARDLSALNLDNVQVAIDRFLLAATERTSAPDALVDAVVSLDALFGSPAEARLRVGGAVAWLLEPDSAEARTQLFKAVGEIYAARSNAVHGNRASRRAGEGMVLEALRLALRVLSAIFYSSQWLLNTPKSADRGLALILGNHDLGKASSDQPPSPAEPDAS
jgi:Apea-like HEPN